jgi:hypothetical protein
MAPVKLPMACYLLPLWLATGREFNCLRLRKATGLLNNNHLGAACSWHSTVDRFAPAPCPPPARAEGRTGPRVAGPRRRPKMGRLYAQKCWAFGPTGGSTRATGVAYPAP